jgi:hypothetical protein
MRCSNCSNCRDDATREHSCYCHLRVKIWIIATYRTVWFVSHTPHAGEFVHYHITSSNPGFWRIVTQNEHIHIHTHTHTHHRTFTNLRSQKLWKENSPRLLQSSC